MQSRFSRHAAFLLLCASIMYMPGRLGAQSAVAPAPPVAPSSAGEAASALIAPESARQGDPVLVWALSTADLKDSELVLVDAGSVAVERSRAFAAPASLLAGAAA
ncbi:MAG: hypothetical protein M0Z80_14805, partial [Treponema sp.]|nr:hypothetical protein [Treponema sp.]